MAGFFSLGSVGGIGRVSNSNHQEDQQNNATNGISPESWFWLKNNDISSQGFELLQQQAQLLQQRQQQEQQQDLYSSAAGLGVGPSRTSIDVVDVPSSRSAFMMMRNTGATGGGLSCQDCGNQAKKDCAHVRCRTCCKSRGFECQTHVKSTWVPASKRREKQQQLAAMQQRSKQQLHQRHQQQQQQQQQHQLQLRGDNHKRLRENPSSSSIVCTRIPNNNNGSGLEVGSFPPEVTSPALFRCVRVTSVDDGDDEYAYQASVNIGGHVFKGVLYDQGPENNYFSNLTGESSSGAGATPVQPLNLITAADQTNTTSTTVTPALDCGVVTLASSTGYLDPSALYPTPLNTYIAGTQFFPSPRSP